MTWAKNDILAAVGASTVVAAGYWADALGPLVGTILAAIGGALLAIRCIGQASMRRRLRNRDQAHEQQLRHRDECLAQTAHELRTPLTAVMNSLEIVRSGMATTREEVDGFLEEADLAAQHLSFLMNDVLDVAAIKAGKLRLEIADHDIEQLIAKSMRMLGMQAARNPITIHNEGHDDGLEVRSDSRRLRQVLFNLVSNSIKHCEPGQPIEIVIRDEGDNVRFRVLDQGVGVADQVRPHLFTAFAGDDQNASADSTGLGLMICRDLIQQMGGTIGYAKRATGSEFWFTLPRADKVIVASAEPVTR
ncbi:MAG: signal transduction histidine kinase [Planctomycetota bacterium]|jgi:signal transduction histidine kinase